MKKIVFIIFLILLGCRQLPLEPYEEELVVYTYLCPNIPRQKVIVDRTYRLNEIMPDTPHVSGVVCKLYYSDTVITLLEGDKFYFTPPG